jgi:hypothetical protein
MKALRLLAAVLLVVTLALHIIVYFRTPDVPGMFGFVVFGIIYGIIGVLLFTKKMYPVYLGLIFPIIGFIIANVKFGFPALISLDAILHLIDIIVVICCAILILNREKPAEVTS